MLSELAENALNRGLAASPRARALVLELQGRRFGVSAIGLPIHYRVSSDGYRLRLERGAGESDATVTGTPVNLIALAGSDPEAVIRRGDVRIDGDAEVAQRFRELGALLRPDIEEVLSRTLGDGAARGLASFAQGALGWARRTAQTSVQNVAEYLAHENGDLVPRSEGQAFFADVDRVREGVDRLDARIAMLTDRAAAK